MRRPRRRNLRLSTAVAVAGGLGDVLWIGGALAALFGGIVVLGKRARRKDQQKAELAARLAACREKSRSL